MAIFGSFLFCRLLLNADLKIFDRIHKTELPEKSCKSCRKSDCANSAAGQIVPMEPTFIEKRVRRQNLAQNPPLWALQLTVWEMRMSHWRTSFARQGSTERFRLCTAKSALETGSARPSVRPSSRRGLASRSGDPLEQKGVTLRNVTLSK